MRLSAMLISLWMGMSPSAGTEPPIDDPLGDIVVNPTDVEYQGPRLMHVTVATELASGRLGQRVEEVVRRDLDLSGQFEVMPPSASESSQTDAALRLVVTPDGQQLKLDLELRFDPTSDEPMYVTSIEGPMAEMRPMAHQLVDRVMEVLTGRRGPFRSRLTFIGERDGSRVVFVMDADGHGLRQVTSSNQVASSSAFGPDDQLYYAASTNGGRYRLYREGSKEPLTIEPGGSIYGIVFSNRRDRVVLTIAEGRNIYVYAGPSDFSELRRIEPDDDSVLAMSPAMGATGSIAFAAALGRKARPRVWVDGKPVTPNGRYASSPGLCREPTGESLIYVSGGRNRSNIVIAKPNGHGARTIASGGRNSHPSCSPDGRLVAYFSSRGPGGPGLYVVRTDGYHPRKVANVQGDSLQWSRLTQ